MELLFQTVAESDVIFWVMIAFVGKAVSMGPSPGTSRIDARLPNSWSHHSKEE